MNGKYGVRFVIVAAQQDQKLMMLQITRQFFRTSCEFILKSGVIFFAQQLFKDAELLKFIIEALPFAKAGRDFRKLL